MVHFSGHGILHRQRPWDAFLKLADGTRLGLLDVLLTPLDGPLVFLNGCRTGDEAVFLRSDVPGLPEAFLAAGARAVIASIRDVPDAAAARFSRVFYEEGGRVDPMAALHRTQARLRAEGHPAWDAYRLYGR
jgi:CHAT domain-containing protein